MTSGWRVVILSLTTGVRTAQSPVSPHIPAGGRETTAELRPGIHALGCVSCAAPLPALRKGWYRGMQALRNCGALRLGHAESGVEVAEITRLASHFSSRPTGTIYRRELRTVITAGTGAMDRICIQPDASLCGA